MRKDFGFLVLGLFVLGCSASDPATGSTAGGNAGTGGSKGGSAGASAGGTSGGTAGTTAGGTAGTTAGGTAGTTSGGTAGTTSGGSSSGGGTAGPAAARFIGRWNSMHQSSWSGSAVELRFTGTDLSVTMSGSNTWYEINVDGTLSKQQIGATAQLATGLANGEHFVQMVRRAESQNGTSQFVSFSVADSAVLPQVVPDRRLEVIGDSLAVSYGFEADCSDKVNAGENAYQSWGWLAARALAADVHIIGWSGAGMATSMYSGTMIPQQYDRTLGGNSAEVWDFSYQPDAVVIDISTNDQNSGSNNPDTFKSTYGTFLTLLRSKYPNAVIYVGSHEGTFATDLQAVVATAADAAHVKYLLLTGASHGACDFHLDAAGHQTYANIVVAAVKADLGWQ